jgi:wyosine [tRNA(Phe)-imidazoG37] synthetase (radical SAM superfamily)
MINFLPQAPTPCQLCDFLGNRLVYAVISQRAGGLLLGVSMNPDLKCNFDCVYCYVNREAANGRRTFNTRVMSAELKALLQRHRQGRFQELPAFADVPEDLLKLKGIALSGEGEPTLCPCFSEAVEEIVNLRMGKQWPDFKLVLITNGSGLHLPDVQHGLRMFRMTDEIWVKLDAGSDAYMRHINHSSVPVSTIINHIVEIGKWRPVVIQSLFCNYQGADPGEEEIDAYIDRLKEVSRRGAHIVQVQVYSIVRPPTKPGCARLSLNQLSAIAKRIRSETGLSAEVY